MAAVSLWRATTTPKSMEPSSWEGSVTVTVVGNGNSENKDGQGVQASFNCPEAVAVDLSGRVMVIDMGAHCVRCINAQGAVSTFAGTAGVEGYRDGPASQAIFNEPRGLAVAEDGTMYVADSANHRIRKITTQGEVLTVAGRAAGLRDGTTSEASFYHPCGLAVDSNGCVIVADFGNHRIRQISPRGVTTLAGNGDIGNKDGPVKQASFKCPLAVAVGPSGHLMATDQNGRLCLIEGGYVSTVASGFFCPSGLLVDCRGNAIVSDTGNHRIVLCSPQGVVTGIAGNGEKGFKDGPNAEASFNGPRGLALDPEGRVIVADWGNHRVRALSLPSTRKLQIELAITALDLPSGCSVTRSAKSLFKWRVVLQVAEGPFRGDLFELSVEMPFNYPKGSPLVKFVPPITHPNVDIATGEVIFVWNEKSDILSALKTVLALLSRVEELLTKQVSLAKKALALIGPKGLFERQSAYDRRVAEPRRALEAAKANLAALHKTKKAPTAEVGEGTLEFWSNTLEGVLDQRDIGEAASKLTAAGFKQRHWGELSRDDLKEAGLKQGVVKDLLNQQTFNKTSAVTLAVPSLAEIDVPPSPSRMIQSLLYLPKIREDELTMGEVLGTGTFSEVWSATWTRTIAVGRQQVTKVPVAVKVPLRGANNQTVLAEMTRDLAVISSLPHQNILTMHGVVVWESSREIRVVYELMSMDLAMLLKQSPQQRLTPTKRMLRVLRDVACGLAHLHAHGVLHRDVKPHNVLLRGEQVKLCDFGSSRDLQQSMQQMTRVGTWDYMAPEVFNRQASGKPADVWSFGVLLFQCVTGELCGPRAVFSDLEPQLQAAGCGRELIEIFEQCHQADEPQRRPTMEEIYNKLQKLVMQASADDDELRLELKRAEAQDRETYDLTWQGIQSSADQQQMQALLDYAKKLGERSQGPRTVVRQPLEGKGSMEELESLSPPEFCKRLHATMQAMVEACGGFYVQGARKPRERCVQKVNKEYGGDFSKLLDVERAMGLFKDAEGMLKCLNLFQQQGQAQDPQQGAEAEAVSQQKHLKVQLLRCKDRLNSPLESGYRDLLLNVKCTEEEQHGGEGFVAELQLNFPELAEIKSHSHRFFELVRVMQLPWVQ